MNEQTLFGRKSKCNSVYSLLRVFLLLLMYLCFIITIRLAFSINL